MDMLYVNVQTERIQCITHNKSNNIVKLEQKLGIHKREITPKFYAVGEVVGGLHGAKRLVHNATPGCIVFGRLCGRMIVRYLLLEIFSVFLIYLPLFKINYSCIVK
jgi:succinate dehydrogenase/fumarate reductase flavoprotein subunit